MIPISSAFTIPRYYVVPLHTSPPGTLAGHLLTAVLAQAPLPDQDLGGELALEAKSVSPHSWKPRAHGRAGAAVKKLSGPA
ncbi:hypothetical protein, partial [Arthrobacter sp. SDTb3-6]|uniref:hypothetical protein n=1 Tax=Arthrobacter sp. SDTb3-6 TaxID=2713571 RepID=UPI001C40008F